MRNQILAIASVFLLSACTTSSSVTTGYYYVKGSDEKSLDRSIRSNSPQNGRAFAETALRLVPVALEPRVDARGCSVGTAKIKVIAAITLPRWSERSGASSSLKRGFDNYAAYAREHEKVHVRIGEAAARALESELKAIPPQANCDILLLKTKAATRKLMSLHNKVQLAFDASEKKRINALLKAARRG